MTSNPGAKGHRKTLVLSICKKKKEIRAGEEQLLRASTCESGTQKRTTLRRRKIRKKLGDTFRGAKAGFE